MAHDICSGDSKNRELQLLAKLKQSYLATKTRSTRLVIVALGPTALTLDLTAVELHILGSKVTHCGEKLALFVPLFLRKSYPPDFWSWPLDGDQLRQFLLDGVEVRILGAKVTLCGGKLALRTYFSALESAVFPFFTRISSFLPLSSTSMFPISFFNLVTTFLPSDFTSFRTRSNVLTIRPTPVAKKSTLLPPAYHSQQVLSVGKREIA